MSGSTRQGQGFGGAFVRGEMRASTICVYVPLLTVLSVYFSFGNALPSPQSSSHEFQIMDLGKQFSPSQFSLAATRFIVMLPFLPLLFAVPGATAVALPIFMAVQDRLRTIIPNLPTRFPSGEGSVSTSSVLSSVNPTKYRGRRAFPNKVQNKVLEVIGNLHKTDDVFEQLISGEPDCRRQAVCRLHYAVTPDIGNFLGNALAVLKLESQVEKLDISTDTRSNIKDMIKAASSGLYRRNCASVYSRCSIVVPPSRA